MRQTEIGPGTGRGWFLLLTMGGGCYARGGMPTISTDSNTASIGAILDEIRAAYDVLGREPVRIMEICGGQTHSILRHGLDMLLPEGITLLHGPGCPVCVTPGAYLDRAIALARRPEVTICAFGDLWRVPSDHSGDLFAAKAGGADVRMVTSPLHALEIAAAEPGRQVVFLAIGFETTAPANALAIQLARRRRLGNVSFLVSQVLLPPAIRRIAVAPSAPDAFLAAGHVCTVTGPEPYRRLAVETGRPIAITGFTPQEILLGVAAALRLLGRLKASPREGAGLFNAYPSSVHSDGAPDALRLIDETFVTCDQLWRGLGRIPDSGLAVRPELAEFDAARRFLGEGGETPTPERTLSADGPGCIAHRILVGLALPSDCPHFAWDCTPLSPLGAPMVSAEGACAAFHLHRHP